ncbi:RHS repeat domain-containing protein [Vibrio harveyi]|uniref:RHS repeat domain-containing protein n=1 Tax=Vibrio harveyi TaxID=669 RepID=UPI0006809A70|nr:RHS repeat protein [Vibrio harveyi]
MSNNISSNAYNFQENISTGVDPRTGDYSVSVSLGSFLSAMTSGLGLSLTLGYSSSSSVDSGFGRGWGFLISRFDKVENKLHLSSGQSFVIEWDFNTGEYSMPYRRVKDIRVQRDSENGKIIVLYKDGRKEILDYEEGYLEEIISSNGISVKLEYKLLNFEYQLSRIYDAFNQEVEIDFRTDEWVTILTHRLDGEIVRSISFDKIGGGGFKRLNRIYFEDSLSMSFGYRYINTGYDLIEKVVHPTGMEEELTYRDRGHSMPQNAPIDSVPFVTQHIIRSGDKQPDRVAVYDFSDKNYLGFASDQIWRPGEDTLFKAESNYIYSTTETINNLHVIRRNYNKYHLLEDAAYEMGGELYKHENNTYFANLEQGIDKQPPIYTFLKDEEVTFFKGSHERKVVTSYDYDIYGNEISVISPDLSETRTEYYKAEGEANCPAHPNGFVSFVKSETYFPSSKETDESRSKYYKYISLAKLNSSEEHMVLLESLQNHDSLELFEYYSDPKELLIYGRVKKESTQVNGVTSFTDYAYDFNVDSLKTTQSINSHDGKQSVNYEVIRCYDGKEIEIAQCVNLVNPENTIVTELKYDSLGRIIQQITAKGSLNEASIFTEYSIGNGQNYVRATDQKGNSQTQHYNNAGNLISVTIADESGIEREVKSSEYNAFGLVANESETDWVNGSIFVSNTTYFEYDNYGQIEKVRHPDGRTETIVQDPTRLTSTFKLDGLIREETVFDVSGNETSKATFDSSDNLLISSSKDYDVYSNLVKVTDTDGNVTRMNYDSSDRLSSVTKYIDGQEVVTKLSYADFSLAELPTEVKLNDHLMGEKDYDGFGRITRESSSKFIQFKQYENDDSIPSYVSNGNGDIRVTHNRFLQSPESIQVSSKNARSTFSQNYSYDQITGAPKALQTNECYSSMHYNAIGQLVSETSVIKGDERHASYKYSLLGLLLEKSDFFGTSEQYDYDDFGRLSIINVVSGGSSTETRIIYDQFSRPFKYATTADGQTVEIELEFNDIGLELYRKTSLVGFGVISENLTEYNSSLQIKEKIYQDYFDGAVRTTVERMEYDDLHRLVRYQSEGPHSPQNEIGLTVLEQAYSHDIYGNITECVTVFDDQSSNVAQYFYDSSNPIILVRVTNSHPMIDDISLSYDAAGNVVSDSSGYIYTYNALNQLTSTQSADGKQSSFVYDPTGSMAQQNSGEGQVNYRYQAGKLVNENSGDDFASYQWLDGVINNRKVSQGSETHSQLLILDSQNSVVGQIQETDGEVEYKKISYTPYGESYDE